MLPRAIDFSDVRKFTGGLACVAIAIIALRADSLWGIFFAGVASVAVLVNAISLFFRRRPEAGLVLLAIGTGVFIYTWTGGLVSLLSQEKVSAKPRQTFSQKALRPLIQRSDQKQAPLASSPPPPKLHEARITPPEATPEKRRAFVSEEEDSKQESVSAVESKPEPRQAFARGYTGTILERELSPGPLKDQIGGFPIHLIAMWEIVDAKRQAEKERDIEGAMRGYAQIVDYYDDPLASPEHIRQDKMAYFKRWPVLEEEVLVKSITFAKLSTYNWQLTFQSRFRAESTERGEFNSGLIANEYRFRPSEELRPEIYLQKGIVSEKKKGVLE